MPFHRFCLLEDLLLILLILLYITLLIHKLFTIAKLLNGNCFWVVKLPLTASGCYNTNFRLLSSLNNKFYSCELKILSYEGLWESENCRGEIRRFDWRKLIDWYRFVTIDWLADIDWFDDLTCQSYFVITKTQLQDLVNMCSNFANFARFRPHYLRTHSIISAAPYNKQKSFFVRFNII